MVTFTAAGPPASISQHPIEDNTDCPGHTIHICLTLFTPHCHCMRIVRTIHRQPPRPLAHWQPRRSDGVFPDRTARVLCAPCPPIRAGAQGLLWGGSGLEIEAGEELLRIYGFEGEPGGKAGVETRTCESNQFTINHCRLAEFHMHISTTSLDSYVVRMMLLVFRRSPTSVLLFHLLVLSTYSYTY